MGTHPIFESDFDCLTDKLKMYRPSGSTRSSTATRGAPAATKSQESVSSSAISSALCTENKEIASAQTVEVEAHVAVTTNVVLEDLQVTGDCDISVSGQPSGAALPRSRRKAWYYNPKTGQQTPIQH